MRFLFATLIISLITFLVWPWIKTFFNYLKKEYTNAKPNESQEQQNEQTPDVQTQTITPKETNNETD